MGALVELLVFTEILQKLSDANSDIVKVWERGFQKVCDNPTSPLVVAYSHLCTTDGEQVEWDHEQEIRNMSPVEERRVYLLFVVLLLCITNVYR